MDFGTVTIVCRSCGGPLDGSDFHIGGTTDGHQPDPVKQVSLRGVYALRLVEAADPLVCRDPACDVFAYHTHAIEDLRRRMVR